MATTDNLQPLTLCQIDLARHALGLQDGRKQSYRNRFIAGPGHPDWADWCVMSIAGYATCTDVADHYCGDLFRLTRAGAEAALFPGEQLDQEDFPA